MTKLVLHVGFPKTASSTLQAHLFAKHPGLHYLGRPFSEAMAAVEKDMLTLDPGAFEEQLAGYQAQVRQEARGAAGKPILISHEGFLRNTRFGGHDEKLTAERIRRVFVESFEAPPDTQVIICIRNQSDLILSHFVQFVKGTQQDLDRHLEAAVEQPTQGFASSLFYCDLLDHYAALFGSGKLHVLLFEEFVENGDAFLSELSGILGIDPKTSAALLKGKHEKQRDRRYGSYVLPNKSSPYFILGKTLKRLSLDRLAERAKARTYQAVTLSDRQKQEIDDLYRATNSAVQRNYRLDLAAYGYPTEESDAVPR